MRFLAAILCLGLALTASSASATDRSSVPASLKPFFDQADQNAISQKIGLLVGPSDKDLPHSAQFRHVRPEGLSKYDRCGLDALQRHEDCLRGEMVKPGGSPDLDAVGYILHQ